MPKIADQVLLMMETVTLPGGTARRANIPGYRVAGKTGTAHKLRADRKGYSTTEYRALFAGVAPVSDPRLAMVVVVENPQGHLLWWYGVSACLCSCDARIFTFNERTFR